MLVFGRPKPCVTETVAESWVWHMISCCCNTLKVPLKLVVFITITAFAIVAQHSN